MEWTIELPADIRGQGRTRHVRNGVDVSSEVATLRIESIDGVPGYYVFYLDSSGRELNDLYFDSQELVVRQVEWEFGISLDHVNLFGQK